MVNDSADVVNERCENRGHARTGSDASQDLPSLEELLFSVKEPQPASGSGVHLTGRSDESLGHAVENDWKGSDSPKAGWVENKGGYISSLCR